MRTRNISSVCLAAMFALAVVFAAAAGANAQIINVNIVAHGGPGAGGGVPAPNGQTPHLEDPAKLNGPWTWDGIDGSIGDGLTWNQLPLEPGNGELCFGSNLLDSTGVTTTVGFNFGNRGTDPWDWGQKLQMLVCGINQGSTTPEGGYAINGLDPNKKYNLYIGSYYANESGNAGTFATTNATSNGSSQYVDNGGYNPGTGDLWAEGVNYVAFLNLEPTAGGTFDFTLAADGTKSAPHLTLMGFQLVALATNPAYWIGGNTTSPFSWNASSDTNFSGTPAGPPMAAPPTTGYEVIFDNITLTLDTTLDADFNVNSLEFKAGSTASVSIAQGASGSLTIGSDGVTVAAGSGAHTISAPVVLGASQPWKINNDTDKPLTVSGQISGDGMTLTKAGSGTLVLSNTGNAYTGGTSLNAGTLQIAALDSLGTGNVTFKGGTLQNAPGSTIDVSGRINAVAGGQLAKIDTNSNDVSFGTGISGDGGLSKLGAGKLTLGAANTYFGDTTISSDGALSLSNSLALQNSTLNYASAGGSIDFAALTDATFGGLTGDKNLVLENTDLVPAAVALSVGQNNATTEYYGNLSGGGSLIKVGGGRLTLNTNDYTGDTTLKDGILRTRTAGSLGTGKIIFEGGTLQYRNHSTDVSGRINPITGGQMAKIDTNGNDVSFDTENGLSGDGGLSKLGAGTLALNVANDYKGGTLLNAGTLQIGNAGSLGIGNVTFQGGTLKYATGLNTDLSGQIPTVAGGQIAKIDTNGNAVEFASPIVGAGGLHKLGDGSLTLSHAGTAIGPATVYAGSLNVNAGTVAALNVPTGGTASLAGSVSGALTVTGGTVNVVSGATVATAALSAGAVAATGGNTLAVTSTLKDSASTQFAWTAGAGSAFLASGANLIDPGVARTVTLTGGTLTISKTAMPSSNMIWLDASNIDGSNNATLTNGAPVATWVDKSGVGNNATASDDQRPSFVASNINGTPALRFNPGTGDANPDAPQHMNLGDLSAQFSNSAATLFVVAAPDESGPDWRYNLFGNRDNDERWVAQTWNESHPGSFRGGRSDGYSLDQWPTTGAHIFVLESNTDLFRMLIDGTNLGDLGADWHNGEGQNWTVGDRPSGGQALRGDIAELLLFNDKLTADEMNNVGGYLAAKYEIASGYTGSIGGTIDLQYTAIGATSTSTLSLPAGAGSLGGVSLSGAGTQLTLSGATSVTFNGNIAATGVGDSPGASITGTPALILARTFGSSDDVAIEVTNSDDRLTLPSFTEPTGVPTSMIKTGAGTLIAGDVTANGFHVYNGAATIQSMTGSNPTTSETSVGAGATLTVNSSIKNVNNIYIGDDSNLATSATVRSTNVTSALNIEGGAAPTGTLDLNDGLLAINYTGESPIDTVRAQIVSAYNAAVGD
ncbi:MAG: autotransporter-associated beta strand repeat-containing protein [Planctomycetota bacterium]|nr:autotransporter-associated beta strand repeat-containing protein [Planctomycetota bacterium]